MSKIGYKETAIIYDLNDNVIQTIKARQISKKIVGGSFMGSGKISQSQTLDIATKDKLNIKVQSQVSRCKFDDTYYLIIAISNHDTKPIKQTNRKEKEFILSLQ